MQTSRDRGLEPELEQKPTPAQLGRRGQNGDYPGCTAEFVNKTIKRRKKNKAAKKSRKQDRKKK